MQKGDFFNCKTVWITGASSGIGEATALALIEQGATVIASAPLMEELEISKAKASFPDKFVCVPLDLSQPDSIDMVATEVLHKYNKIDILINNAGISQRSKVLETPIINYRKIMEIDYFGTVILTKSVLPKMITQGGGHILCTSSMVGLFGFPLRSAYSAAKHALHGFFESLRIEYYHSNIKVGIIVGGRIQSAISLNALTGDGSPYGLMDKGQQNGISTQIAAKQILRGIQNDKQEILVGGKELILIYLKRWFPLFHFKIAKKINPT